MAPGGEVARDGDAGVVGRGDVGHGERGAGVEAGEELVEFDGVVVAFEFGEGAEVGAAAWAAVQVLASTGWTRKQSRKVGAPGE